MVHISCGKMILVWQKNQIIWLTFQHQSKNFLVLNVTWIFNIRFAFELPLVLIISFFFSGHDESYNPPLEYIPTQEEINSYQLLYEEDRPKFIPKRYCAFRVNIFASLSHTVELITLNCQIYIYEKHPGVWECYEGEFWTLFGFVLVPPSSKETCEWIPISKN